MSTVKLNYNPEEMDKAASRRYADGAMRTKVTGVKCKQSKEKPGLGAKSPKKFHMELLVKPLTDPTSPSSVSGRGLRTWITLPVEPPHWAGLPKQLAAEYRAGLAEDADRTAKAMRGLFPELPQPPTREDADSPWVFGGKALKDAKEIDKAFKSVRNAAVAKAVECYEAGGKSLIGKTPYITTYTKENSSSGVAETNVGGLYAGIPEDKDGEPRPILTGGAIYQGAPGDEEDDLEDEDFEDDDSEDEDDFEEASA